MDRTETPIACTLSSAALAARLAWIRQVTHQSLVSHRQDGATLHLVYERNARQELERIVEGERQCCGFLEFDLRDAGRRAELTIRAPDVPGVEATWLFEQFLPQAAPPHGCGCASGTCKSP